MTIMHATAWYNGDVIMLVNIQGSQCDAAENGSFFGCWIFMAHILHDISDVCCSMRTLSVQQWNR
jgi:hypothetical protein